MATDAVTERRREAGFTMIEVLVAILLTALTVIGVLGLFRIETRASSFSRRETEAAVLAQDKLEELRTLTAPSGTGSGSDEPVNPFGPQQIFQRSWTIEPNPDDSSIYNIEVKVEWNDNGVPRDVVVRGQRGGS